MISQSPFWKTIKEKSLTNLGGRTMDKGKENLFYEKGGQNCKQIIVFCQNVKMLRERNELSKKEMAKILGIGTVGLAKIEQGIIPSRAGVDAIFKLAQYCKIKPHKLFEPL